MKSGKKGPHIKKGMIKLIMSAYIKLFSKIKIDYILVNPG